LTKLFLIRHGETQNNVELKYQGNSNQGLTEKGILQAESIAKYLQKENFEAIYSSALRRAFQTAEIIGSHHSLLPNTNKGLNEIDFGGWEGLTYNEIESQYPGVFEKWVSGADGTEIPGGEARTDFHRRISSAVSSITKSHPNGQIAIVTHGGPIKSILCNILEVNPTAFWRIKQSNTALNIVEFYEESGFINLVNDTCHLKSR
jgi:alpha-ribazole phosphatase